MAAATGRARGVLRAAVLLAAAAAVQACIPFPAIQGTTEYCLPYYSWIPSQPRPEALSACTPIGTPKVEIAVQTGQTLAYPLTGITFDTTAPFVSNPAVSILWDDALSKYLVSWASSSTEDVQGYQCLTISRGTASTPTAAKVTTCAQQVCRKLCTRPTWRLTAGMTVVEGADVTNQHWSWPTPARVGTQVSFVLEVVNYIIDDVVT
ncbi:hypothetical protein T484DRAFT_1751285 [Baffinella frigidus]|nr:hypothetical protein T484DRAFT_1751285 [Cryptophyta sp. CCMP2293]